MIALTYPLFAMFCLSFIVGVMSFRARVTAVRTGKLDARYFKTFNVGTPPENVVKLSRHYANLFELPVLFYTAVLLALILRIESQSALVWSWLFVIARVTHAFIHIGPNKLIPRIAAFMMGWVALTGLWGTLFLAIQK